MLTELVDRNVDERLLNRVIDCILSAYSNNMGDKNALRFSK